MGPDIARWAAGNGCPGAVTVREKEIHVRPLINSVTKAYVCRGCGTSVSYPGTFRKCPVCGIKWG